MDRKNYPKHAEFYFKNKFEKLVHLVGFIIRSIENLAIVQGSRCATELTTDIYLVTGDDEII